MDALQADSREHRLNVEACAARNAQTYRAALPRESQEILDGHWQRGIDGKRGPSHAALAFRRIRARPEARVVEGQAD